MTTHRRSTTPGSELDKSGNQGGWEMKITGKNILTVLLVLILLSIVTIAILTIIGPSIGSTFSNTVSSGPVGQGGGFVEEGGGFLDVTVTPLIEIPATQAGTPGAEQQSGPGIPAAQQQRMIIKNGAISLLVENTNTAVDQVTRIAADNGGYALNTQIYLEGEVKAADMTIAVESGNFDAAMHRLGEIALEVLQESSSGEDVTAEYVDLQSRLKNLESTRDRLREFLAEAENTEEALNVNRELSQIEGEIEIVIGRMNYLSGRAAFSTIVVSIHQFVDATPTPTPTSTPTVTPWVLGPAIKSASQTQVRTFQSLLEALTWIVIVLGPYIIVLGLIGYGVWRFRRRRQVAQFDQDYEEPIDEEDEI
jgi:hypothetical protein